MSDQVLHLSCALYLLCPASKGLPQARSFGTKSFSSRSSVEEEEAAPSGPLELVSIDDVRKVELLQCFRAATLLSLWFLFSDDHFKFFESLFPGLKSFLEILVRCRQGHLPSPAAAAAVHTMEFAFSFLCLIVSHSVDANKTATILLRFLAYGCPPTLFFQFMQKHRLRITLRVVNIALAYMNEANSKIVLSSCPRGYFDFATRETKASDLLPILPGAAAVCPTLTWLSKPFVEDEDNEIDAYMEGQKNSQEEYSYVSEFDNIFYISESRIFNALIGMQRWFFSYIGTSVWHGPSPFTQVKDEHTADIHQTIFASALAMAFEDKRDLAFFDFVLSILPLIFPTYEKFAEDCHFFEYLTGIAICNSGESVTPFFKHALFASKRTCSIDAVKAFIEACIDNENGFFIDSDVFRVAYNVFNWKDLPLDAVQKEILSLMHVNENVLDCGLRKYFFCSELEDTIATILDLFFFSKDCGLECMEKLCPFFFMHMRPSFFNHLHFHYGVSDSIFVAVANQWRTHVERIILALWCQNAGLLRIAPVVLQSEIRSLVHSNKLSARLQTQIAQRVGDFWFGLKQE